MSDRKIDSAAIFGWIFLLSGVSFGVSFVLFWVAVFWLVSKL